MFHSLIVYIGKRDVKEKIDDILNSFGILAYWNQIQEAGFATALQLQATLLRIYLSGKGSLEKAGPVLKDLGAELSGHTVNTYTSVKKAVERLNSILYETVYPVPANNSTSSNNTSNYEF